MSATGKRVGTTTRRSGRAASAVALPAQSPRVIAAREHAARKLRQYAIASTLLPDGRMLTQEMIAEAIGVHPAAVSRVIAGATRGVGRETAEQIRQEICRLTGRSYLDLWHGVPLPGVRGEGRATAA